MMDLGISGKRALVLGASGGLGGAVAAALVAEGVVVHAAARSVEKLAAIKSGLTEAGERYAPTPVDLADMQAVTALADALNRDGGIDILVNNGGGPAPGPALGQTPEAWAKAFSMMATPIFHLTGLLVPHMVENRWGRILTIGSSGIVQPIPNLALSNGTRGAVAGWSKTLASELAPHGITVNIVVPGRIATDRVAQLDQAAARREDRPVADIESRSRSQIPAGRYGRPAEFAAVCAFLTGRDASYVTGSMIRVDGGMIGAL